MARRPDPWAWPDWAFAGEDGTFGNRYDDPESEFRVLYASSDRLTCFLETLARFRPDPHAKQVVIKSDPRDAEFPTSGDYSQSPCLQASILRAPERFDRQTLSFNKGRARKACAASSTTGDMAARLSVVSSDAPAERSRWRSFDSHVAS